MARPKLFLRTRVYPRSVTFKARVLMSTFVVLSPRVAGSPLGTSVRAPGSSRNASSRARRCASVRVHADSTVKVCVNKECKRAGSKRTLAMFEALAEAEGVDVVEVVCLDECGMGPNVQCGEDGPIVNGVKTQDDVDEAVAKAKAE